MTTITVLYEADIPYQEGETDPLVGNVRVSSNTTNLTIDGNANVSPTGVTANSLIPIRVSSKRKLGIIARHLVLERIGGTSPNTFPIRRNVVVFDPTLFKLAIVGEGLTISYEGNDTWKLVGAHNEGYNLRFNT
jgi:hypothetical protein